MPLLRRLARIACWLAVATAYVAAIMPPAEAPHLGGSDKLDHMAAFFTIVVLARVGYPRTRPWVILALAAAFGALIELTQALPIIGRDAELGDWIADVAATLLALFAVWPAVIGLRRRDEAAG